MAKSKNGKKPSAAQHEEEPRELTIRYLRDDETPTMPVTGAVGSVHPDGSSVAVHFFHEYNTLPTSSHHPINEAGIANVREGREEKESEITRAITFTGIMSPKTAQQIGKWLIDKSEAARNVRDKLKDREVSDDGLDDE